VSQERLGPSYFFISLLLGPLNSLFWYVPSSRYSSSPILFLQEQIKDIIIISVRRLSSAHLFLQHLLHLQHLNG
jgi:hypothetical protein